jgi:RNA polymerase sigma factor (sigma-70 family)
MTSLPEVSQAGSRRDRFQAVYEANYHRVLGYALRRLDRDDAGDVVAETFLVAWRRLDDVPNGDAARLWLYGTARRVLANQQRARRRRERLSERIRADLVPEGQPAPADPDVDAASAAFARLRADERELLALVAWEGLDAGEIAQVYGCSRNAARIRVHRARRRFARELARFGGSLKQNPVGGHMSEAHE